MNKEQIRKAKVRTSKWIQAKKAKLARKKPKNRSKAVQEVLQSYKKEDMKEIRVSMLPYVHGAIRKQTRPRPKIRGGELDKDWKAEQEAMMMAEKITQERATQAADRLEFLKRQMKS